MIMCGGITGGGYFYSHILAKLSAVDWLMCTQEEVGTSAAIHLRSASISCITYHATTQLERVPIHQSPSHDYLVKARPSASGRTS